ncbi:MAG: hypothetical protein OXE53_13050 [Deltaproteobacteria bacterium]|nr:hypothetical protein [Deltaproteobacteria bacterium]
MPLNVPGESGVTLAEFTAYLGRRLQSKAAIDAEDAEKEAALRQAWRDMAALEWKGWRTSPSQEGPWPRSQVPRADQVFGGGSFVPSDEIPERVKWAQMEWAAALIEVVAVGGDAGVPGGAPDLSAFTSDLKGLKRVKAGSLEIEAVDSLDISGSRAASAGPLNDGKVGSLLAPYLAAGPDQFRLVV